MKFYKNYIIVIMLLALVLNWVVEGSSFMDKANMNLGLLPKFSIIVIEILQILVLARILLIHYRNSFIIKAIVAAILFCAFEFIVLKAMGANILIWFSGIRYYLSFFPLFIISYLITVKGYSIKRELKWLIILILLQIPVAVYQFLNVSKVNLLSKRQPLFDMISGTMGGNASNLMSLVIGIAFLYFLIKFIENKKIGYLLLSFALLIPPVLAEAKGMLILILIILFYIAFIFKFNFTRMLGLGVLAAFMVAGFTYIYSIMGYAKPINISYLIDYVGNESGKGRLSRIDSIFYSFELLFKNETLLFGTGIGNANKSPLDHDGQFYDFFMIRHSIDILISETGLLGITLLVFLIWKLFFITKSLIRNNDIIQNENDILILKVFLGSIFIFIFGLGWFDALFRVQFMYPFGMMAGYAVGLYHKVKHDKSISDNQQYDFKYKLA